MNQSFFWLHYFCCSWIRSLGTEPLDDNSPTELQRWKNALCPLKEEKVEQKHLVRLGSNSTEVRDADLLELVNISDPNNERLGSHGNKRNLPNWTPYWHPRTSQTSSKHREKFNSYQNTVWITTNCGKFLPEMGISDHLICLLRNLYAGQEQTVRNGIMDWFKTGKGVH